MNQIEQSGLIILYTGDGKGKTTAALGLCLRAVGHGRRVGIIQFMKSDWEYGELKSLKQFLPQVTIKTLGAGCVGIMGDDKPFGVHKEAAVEALAQARKECESGKYDILILDEINIALHLKLIDLTDVVDLLENKPDNLHCLLTGRKAPDKLIELADLVTEMKEIKHPFQKGVVAQKGIDF